jgi:protein Tex
MDLFRTIAENLSLPEKKVRDTIELLNSDNTIPFIARYRKEVTGNLDEEQIHKIKIELQRVENLEDRRKTVLESIAAQGKLTESLKQQILTAKTLTILEDLYLPYRPKRRTRGMIAREKGLEPLALMILQQKVSSKSLQSLVKAFINEQVPDGPSAIAGASDIAAEMINDNGTIRQMVREKGFAFGKLVCAITQGAEDNRKVYEIYYQFELPIKHLKPHQILAINRGEKEKVLKAGITIPERDWLTAVHCQYAPDRKSLFHDFLQAAIEDGVKRLLLPSIERDIRRTLTENAESHAIDVFARNLRGLLTQPPLSGQVILAIDPGFRTGSKVAVIDQTGKLLDTATIFPHPPQNRKAESYQVIDKLIAQYKVTLIVIGNGTASRETESFIAEITKKDPKLKYLITSEAGASVYSASKLARKEFPELDVSMRGAVSIGRRVQDPLAELVKIDPKSIGVGLYQHDVNQTQLSLALDQTVESVVNAVGADVNTASSQLLTYIAGIGPTLAVKIIDYRDKNGPFKDRLAISNVPGMGTKSFEQSAGFLRIRDGSNPLDATAIHPESYLIAQSILNLVHQTVINGALGNSTAIENFKRNTDLEALSKSLNTGLPTLEDILDEIARSGRDPRQDIPKPILRKDILNMDDLSQGMALTGTIRNVVDFGAFVDIGVKVDGLLHRSKIKSGITLKVGDIIDVCVLSIDHERGRIALEMKETTHDDLKQ